MKAGNQTLLKKNNQRAIAEYIIKKGPISRADLSKSLKISKPTVSANVTELMEMQLLKEIGYSETDIGKKPMLMDFNKEFRYVLAMDFISYITRNKISVAVCNLYCEPVFIDTIDLPPRFDADTIRLDVPRALLSLFEKNNIPVDRIGKLVLTAPTAWYDDDHVTFECRNGEKVNLAEIFSPYFKGKTAVKNDINLAALGEKYFGVGKEANHLVFFWVGLAVGGGIILNGQLYEGKNMIGGELAYSIVHNDVTNQYEYFRDITDIGGIQRYIKANLAAAEKSSIAEFLLSGNFYLDMLIDAALDGDQFCIDFARFVGRMAAVLITNFCNTMDMQMAIVGGEYTKFGDIFLNEIYSKMNENPIANAKVTVPHYPNSAMFGAFKFGADNIIEHLI